MIISVSSFRKSIYSIFRDLVEIEDRQHDSSDAAFREIFEVAARREPFRRRSLGPTSHYCLRRCAMLFSNSNF